MMLFRLEDFRIVTELPERIRNNKDNSYFLKSGSRIYSPSEFIDSPVIPVTTGIVQVCVRVRGGKGGFGSRLKAEGNRLSNPKRSGNYAECRDVEGRKLRDVRDAQMIQEYLDREPELKAKANAERVSYYQKVLSSSGVSKPKHTKRDEEYEQSRQRGVSNIEAAVSDFDLKKIKKK